MTVEQYGFLRTVRYDPSNPIRSWPWWKISTTVGPWSLLATILTWLPSVHNVQMRLNMKGSLPLISLEMVFERAPFIIRTEEELKIPYGLGMPWFKIVLKSACLLLLGILAKMIEATALNSKRETFEDWLRNKMQWAWGETRFWN